MAEDAAEPGIRKGPQKIEKPVSEGNADRLFQLGQILTRRVGKRRMRRLNIQRRISLWKHLLGPLLLLHF